MCRRWWTASRRRSCRTLTVSSSGPRQLCPCRVHTPALSPLAITCRMTLWAQRVMNSSTCTAPSLTTGSYVKAALFNSLDQRIACKLKAVTHSHEPTGNCHPTPQFSWVLQSNIAYLNKYFGFTAPMSMFLAEMGTFFTKKNPSKNRPLCSAHTDKVNH